MSKSEFKLITSPHLSLSETFDRQGIEEANRVRDDFYIYSVEEPDTANFEIIAVPKTVRVTREVRDLANDLDGDKVIDYTMRENGSIIHPRATYDKPFDLGTRSAIYSPAVIGEAADISDESDLRSAVIGARAQIGMYVIAEEGSEIGPDVLVEGRSLIKGGTKLGAGTTVRVGSILETMVVTEPRSEIGPYNIVGIGATFGASSKTEEAVVIGEGAVVKAGAVVKGGTHVEPWTTVEASKPSEASLVRLGKKVIKSALSFPK